MLLNPRIYNWNIGTQEPFVNDETAQYRRESLRAGDGHAIPFSRRILQSEYYWRADSCRAELFVQEGDSPYPGVSYVMDVHLNGYNRRLNEHVEFQMRRWVPTPGHLQGGPVDFGLRIASAPALGAGESHWTANVTLIADASIEQVGQRRDESPLEARVIVRGTLRTVTVRYTCTHPSRS
jgi:hypothetical protein